MERKYIRLWGEHLRSNEDYISYIEQRAEEDNAPENAIYFDTVDKSWKTTDDIKNDALRICWGLDKKDKPKNHKITKVELLKQDLGMYGEYYGVKLVFDDGYEFKCRIQEWEFEEVRKRFGEPEASGKFKENEIYTINY